MSLEWLIPAPVEHRIQLMQEIHLICNLYNKESFYQSAGIDNSYKLILQIRIFLIKKLK